MKHINATMPTIVDPMPQMPGDPLPHREQHEHEHPTPAPIELPPEPKAPHPSPDPKEVTKEPRTPHPGDPRPSHPERNGTHARARERASARMR